MIKSIHWSDYRHILIGTLLTIIITSTFSCEQSHPPLSDSQPHIELINLGGQQSLQLLQRVNTHLHEAMTPVEQFWHAPWPAYIFISATDNINQFAHLAGGEKAIPAQWTNIAAVTLSHPPAEFSQHCKCGQILLAPHVSHVSDMDLHIILTHELFHYISLSETAADAPRWLVEGTADFIARPHLLPQTKPLSPTRLPNDHDVSTLVDDPNNGYDQTAWFVSFIDHIYGEDTLRQFYRHACAPGHTTLTTTIRDILGISPQELLILWQQWLNSISSI